MKKTMRKIIPILALAAIIAVLLFAPIGKHKSTNSQIKVVTTIFPAYDFARTLSANTETELKMLIQPGNDIHSYDPTPQDIVNAEQSDIFIYNGGESEKWVDKILTEIDQNRTTSIRMMDYVELLEEPTPNSDNNAEYDEHIWTSPKNVVKITAAIAQALINHNQANRQTIQNNLSQLKDDLTQLDQDFTRLAQQKNGTLIVADRFPFYYFIKDYGFDYLAALPGCTEQTEASAKTIAELSNKVAQNHEKIIFTLELSNTRIAQTIAQTTGAKIATWHSVHNVSQSDFESGKTYLDFMNENLNKLSEALHDRAEG